jgi:hypothetical protein
MIRSGDIDSQRSLSRFGKAADLRVTGNSQLAERRIRLLDLNAFIVAHFLQLQQAALITTPQFIATASSTTSTSRNEQPTL